MKNRLRKMIVRFDSLSGESRLDMAERINEDMGLRLDAGETVLFSRQLEFIYATPRQVLYTPLKTRLFLPVDSSVDNAAETYTYRVYDKVGIAKILSSYASKDIPSVSLTGKEVTGKIRHMAAKFDYSVQELRRAARAKMPLERSKEMAAFEANELLHDKIGAFGDTDHGLVGFLNHPNVPLVTPITGAWTSATAPGLIVADLNKLVNSIVTATNEVHAPDTLLLGTDEYGIIATTPWSGHSDVTILKWFLLNNPYIKNIDQWQRCNLANAAGNGPRAVAYRRNPTCVQLVIPQESERTAPQVDGLNMEVIVHARNGGVKFEHPLSAAYMDGL